ncbi:hypothetical protein ANCCAN_07536 [Ancylostoma caninum]|uniref:Uncharacterized protein n=1 Tax=Ancylostoma caninum TaxID=29170 RepID=A0A368GS47_ANCCA|nr:hypothetical protein ANCCAN_07536 [Ancylostoma caninum]
MCLEIGLKERLNVFFACVANPKTALLLRAVNIPERFTIIASRLHVSEILNGVTFSIL